MSAEWYDRCPEGHARWCAFRNGHGPCDCPEFPMPERDR